MENDPSVTYEEVYTAVGHNGNILYETYKTVGVAKQRIQQMVLRTSDEYFRKALVESGWTAPRQSPPAPENAKIPELERQIETLNESLTLAKEYSTTVAKESMKLIDENNVLNLKLAAFETGTKIVDALESSLNQVLQYINSDAPEKPTAPKVINPTAPIPEQTS